MSGQDDTTDLSLGRETAVAVVAKLVLAAMGFVGVVVFARVLGTEGVGKYYFLLAMAKVTTQIPGGVSNAIKKRVSEVGVDPAEFFGLGLVVNAAFTSVVLAVAVVGYPFLKSQVGPFAFALGVVAIVASLGLFSLVNRLYAGIGHPGASFWTDTIRSVLTLVAQVAFLVAGLNVLGLMGGLVLATLVTTVGVAVLTNVRPRIPTRETAERVSTFAKWSVPNALFQNLYMRLDVLILGFVVSNAAVGLYEPAMRLTVPAAFIATGIGDSLTVKASGLSSLDRDVGEDLRNALSYACLFAIPIFFGALAIPEALMVVIYGEEFRAGWVALVGLALFQLFNTYRLPFDNVVSGMNRPDLRFRVSVFTLAINAPLAILLGLEYGLVGVVVATVIAETVRVVTYLLIARRLFDDVLLPRPLFEQFAAGAVMFGVVYGASEAVAITDAITLAAVVGLGAVTYFGVLLAVSSHFRVTIRGVLADFGIERAPGL
ncbi:oligosaccharide flippase family protein [Halorussus amylolyticus]|uniref:oligosaccharide flippase family protein n=1 Tax=Halorussus amylolyticus TaxID=1126242 RepID=UPI001042E8C7|nr:polysaccharide biosynthesis C-terminal domain-containing protein [Halorussus amylolyticus]